MSEGSPWNFADAAYRLGDSPRADLPALIHGDTVISYRELRRRSSGIGAFLQGLGLAPGAHVGFFLSNSNAYLEAFVGAGLAGHTHVNINYRYREQELANLCLGLDIEVLVYDAALADRVEAIRDRVPGLRHCLRVGGSGSDTAFESLYDWPSDGFQPQPSGDDLLIIATGGTTGLPKGVMWRHSDLWRKQSVCTGVAMMPLGLTQAPPDMVGHIANVCALPQAGPMLVLSPLMHGTGLMMAAMLLAQGVAVATLGGNFDAGHSLAFIREHGVASLVLVGDGFALPLVEALQGFPGEPPLASLRMLVSSGAALSDQCRQALLGAQPGLVIVDSLGSSETSGYAVNTAEPGTFMPNPTTVVLDDDLQPVAPGSATVGMVYATGYLPQGYYKAPEATASTFVTIGDQRYVRTGDRCRVREDGLLELLGRDSTVINSGGEKVYTVEVERVLQQHPAIDDVLVVGLPHPRFGRQVVAVVESDAVAAGALDCTALRQWAAGRLADYKLPRLLFAMPSLQRAANGKPNYPLVTDYAGRCLAALEQQ